MNRRGFLKGTLMAAGGSLFAPLLAWTKPSVIEIEDWYCIGMDYALGPDASVVIIATRAHYDDFFGEPEGPLAEVARDMIGSGKASSIELTLSPIAELKETEIIFKKFPDE